MKNFVRDKWNQLKTASRKVAKHARRAAATAAVTGGLILGGPAYGQATAVVVPDIGIDYEATATNMAGSLGTAMGAIFGAALAFIILRRVWRAMNKIG